MTKTVLKSLLISMLCLTLPSGCSERRSVAPLETSDSSTQTPQGQAAADAGETGDSAANESAETAE